MNETYAFSGKSIPYPSFSGMKIMADIPIMLKYKAKKQQITVLGNPLSLITNIVNKLDNDRYANLIEVVYHYYIEQSSLYNAPKMKIGKRGKVVTSITLDFTELFTLINVNDQMELIEKIHSCILDWNVKQLDNYTFEKHPYTLTLNYFTDTQRSCREYLINFKE